MQEQKFPMVLTHRANRHAVITVANAEQLAAVPPEYLPEGTVPAAAPAPGVNLEEAHAALAERQKGLDAALDDFAAHVESEISKMDAARAQIRADRATLDQQTAALNEQVEALARERAEFEAQKAEKPAADAPADAGAPAKRTRGAKTEG